MTLMDLPHVTGTHTEIEMQRDGSVDVVVVVETELELGPLHPKHEKTKVDSLVQALSSHLISDPHRLRRLRLKTVGH
jgi:hypothetical protein